MVLANITTQLPVATVSDEIRNTVDRTVRKLLGSRLYTFYFQRITWELSDGCLTLRGAVPTFYLKQVLQTRLKDIAGVDRLVNEVDVINSGGLSSVNDK